MPIEPDPSHKYPNLYEVALEHAACIEVALDRATQLQRDVERLENRLVLLEKNWE